MPASGWVVGACLASVLSGLRAAITEVEDLRRALAVTAAAADPALRRCVEAYGVTGSAGRAEFLRAYA